jgi:hypothetical protein
MRGGIGARRIQKVHSLLLTSNPLVCAFDRVVKVADCYQNLFSVQPSVVGSTREFGMPNPCQIPHVRRANLIDRISQGAI